tara:strand:+ start:27 stop:221 length:195 start_codon:yes stop_codon:yes gene_type:complete
MSFAKKIREYFKATDLESNCCFAFPIANTIVKHKTNQHMTELRGVCSECNEKALFYQYITEEGE